VSKNNNIDDLFDRGGDPLDDPAGETATERKTRIQVADHVGCPMGWLEQVLPYVQGECQLVVALLLYRRWVICGRRRTFDFPNRDLNKLGISRSVKHKTLTSLEDADLIAVERANGSAPLVTRRWK